MRLPVPSSPVSAPCSASNWPVASKRFAASSESLKVFTLAELLGGVESLVAHPATMTHAGMSEEARRVAGITGGLLRLSIGLEGEADLVADLQNGCPRRACSGEPGPHAIKAAGGLVDR